MDRSMKEYLQLMTKALKAATESHKKGESPSADILRMTALGYACMEDHGVPNSSNSTNVNKLTIVPALTANKSHIPAVA